MSLNPGFTSATLQEQHYVGREKRHISVIDVFKPFSLTLDEIVENGLGTLLPLYPLKHRETVRKLHSKGLIDDAKREELLKALLYDIKEASNECFLKGSITKGDQDFIYQNAKLALEYLCHLYPSLGGIEMIDEKVENSWWVPALEKLDEKIRLLEEESVKLKKENKKLREKSERLEEKSERLEEKVEETKSASAQLKKEVDDMKAQMSALLSAFTAHNSSVQI
jgi:uncharacterized phage infection (PIP) family protein YhgE